jgi:hypothetical protein
MGDTLNNDEIRELNELNQTIHYECLIAENKLYGLAPDDGNYLDLVVKKYKGKFDKEHCIPIALLHLTQLMTIFELKKTNKDCKFNLFKKIMDVRIGLRLHSPQIRKLLEILSLLLNMILDTLLIYQVIKMGNCGGFNNFICISLLISTILMFLIEITNLRFLLNNLYNISIISLVSFLNSFESMIILQTPNINSWFYASTLVFSVLSTYTSYGLVGVMDMWGDKNSKTDYLTLLLLVSPFVSILILIMRMTGDLDVYCGYTGGSVLSQGFYDCARISDIDDTTKVGHPCGF